MLRHEPELEYPSRDTPQLILDAGSTYLLTKTFQKSSGVFILGLGHRCPMQQNDRPADLGPCVWAARKQVSVGVPTRQSGDLRHEGGCCLSLGARTLGCGVRFCGADAYVCRVDNRVNARPPARQCQNGRT